MKNMKNGILALSLLLVLDSCDIYQSDTKPAFTDFGNIDVFTPEGSSTVVYSKAFFNPVYEQGLKFSITQQPTEGTLQVLENGEFLYYQPSEGSTSIDDNLSLVIVSSNGRTLGKANVRFLSETGCGRGPVVTNVQTTNDEPIQIDFLDNDVFCGPLTNPDDNGPFLIFDANGNYLEGGLAAWNSKPTSHGTMEYRSIEGKFVIEYTPKEDFVGTDVLYWGVFEGYKGEGDLFPDHFWEHPEWWTRYYIGRLEIEVTE